MDLTDDDDDHFNTHTLRIVKRFFSFRLFQTTAKNWIMIYYFGVWLAGWCGHYYPCYKYSHSRNVIKFCFISIDKNINGPGK